MEITCNKVSYIYNEGLTISKKALNNINIKLEENKIYGIIGKSGSGKTTLLQLLDNLLIPSDGSILIGDYKINKSTKIKKIKEFRKNIGIVFQFPEEQFFETTIKKEVEFALKNFNHEKVFFEQKIIKALKMVGLNEEYLEKNPFSLSNGEKRRVAIASVLVYNPNVLILDQPTAGLDLKNKRILIELLKKINKKYNKKIIIASHDIDMLYSLADDIIILEKGNVLVHGNKEEVFKNTKLLKTHNINIPKIIEFTNKVMDKKDIKLGNYNDIKDLIKAVYRNV